MKRDVEEHAADRRTEGSSSFALVPPWVAQHPSWTIVAFAVAALAISPLVLGAIELRYAFASGGPIAIEWAQILESVFTSLALAGGAFAVVKWSHDRKDRATDVLLKLYEKFSEPQYAAGKKLLEEPPVALSKQQVEDLDRVLSFYILLRGVVAAGQVPQRSLSFCFAWWLAQCYRPDQHCLKAHVGRWYPELQRWLETDLQDVNPTASFFRAREFWPTGHLSPPAREAMQSGQT